ADRRQGGRTGGALAGDAPDRHGRHVGHSGTRRGRRGRRQQDQEGPPGVREDQRLPQQGVRRQGRRDRPVAGAPPLRLARRPPADRCGGHGGADRSRRHRGPATRHAHRRLLPPLKEAGPPSAPVAVSARSGKGEKSARPVQSVHPERKTTKKRKEPPVLAAPRHLQHRAPGVASSYLSGAAAQHSPPSLMFSRPVTVSMSRSRLPVVMAPPRTRPSPSDSRFARRYCTPSDTSLVTANSRPPP